MNLLFICSRNQWRSPTAETIWRRKPGYNVRSAGVAKSAKRKVQEADISWSDLIFAMEREHKQKLKMKFPHCLDLANLPVLDIPDEYGFMDPDLVDVIETSVAAILEGSKN